MKGGLVDDLSLEHLRVAGLAEDVLLSEAELDGREPALSPFGVLLRGREFLEAGLLHTEDGQVDSVAGSVVLLEDPDDLLPPLAHETVVVLLVNVEGELVAGPAEGLRDPREVRQEDRTLDLRLLDVVDLLTRHDEVTLLRPIVHVYLLYSV